MVIYFTAQYVEQIHNKILEISGGRQGFSDKPDNLEKVDFIRNDDYYPNFEEKLSYLVYSVNKNHIFTDGNKRTSIGIGAYFLKINGYEYCVQKFINEMENIAVAVAANVVSRDLLLQIITSIIYENDFSESLKLEIYHALSKLVETEDVTAVDYNEII